MKMQDVVGVDKMAAHPTLWWLLEVHILHG
jgi:hypothetical protein